MLDEDRELSSFDIIYTRREYSLLNDSSLLGVQVDSSLCIIIIKFSNVWDFNLWVRILKCYRELVFYYRTGQEVVNRVCCWFLGMVAVTHPVVQSKTRDFTTEVDSKWYPEILFQILIEIGVFCLVGTNFVNKLLSDGIDCDVDGSSREKISCVTIIGIEFGISSTSMVL